MYTVNMTTCRRKRLSTFGGNWQASRSFFNTAELVVIVE